MPAAYEQPRVTVEPEGRALRVRLRLKNASRKAWRRAEGFCLGWQLFDPKTALFIREGEWAAMETDLEPEQSAVVDLLVELPPERGHYHVYLSPRSEPEGWHYRTGAAFLLIAALVEEGRARLLDTRVTTVARLHRQNRWRSFQGALTLPALTIWRHRGLIRSMVRRDIAGRYRGSLGDVLWTFLHPLLLMLTYFFVFGVVLQARFGADPSRSGFALYFLAGLLPWLPFQEALGRAPTVLLEHRNFVKKMVFPVETLPVHQALAGLVTEAFALVVFLAFLVALRGALPVTALWLPVLLVPQLLFTLGAGWFLAALGVFVRDLGHIIGFLLTLWFFLTPICYPEASLPAPALEVLRKNPMYVLVRGYRAILLEGQAPSFEPLWKLWLVALLVCVLGHAFFYKLRRSFADVI